MAATLESKPCSPGPFEYSQTMLLAVTGLSARSHKVVDPHRGKKMCVVKPGLEFNAALSY